MTTTTVPIEVPRVYRSTRYYRIGARVVRIERGPVGAEVWLWSTGWRHLLNVAYRSDEYEDGVLIALRAAETLLAGFDGRDPA